MTDFFSSPSDPTREFYSFLALGRMVHAYLVVGPAGSGKYAFVRDAACALLCVHRREDATACGECDSCVRMRAGSHPDLITLSAAKTSIGVEEVRAMLGLLSAVAYANGGRVVVVRQADRLTIQAQNVLLKALEEPPDGVIYFLIVRDLSLILPTVLSRCRLIRMTPRGEVERLLIEEGAEPKCARELAVLSGDAVERARELFCSSACKEAREKALSVLALRCAADIPALWQSIREDKELAEYILLWIECAAAEALRSQAGISARISGVEHFTFSGLRGIIDEVILIRKKLGSNVPWYAAVEPLLYWIAKGATI